MPRRLGPLGRPGGRAPPRGLGCPLNVRQFQPSETWGGIDTQDEKDTAVTGAWRPTRWATFWRGHPPSSQRSELAAQSLLRVPDLGFSHEEKLVLVVSAAASTLVQAASGVTAVLSTPRRGSGAASPHATSTR